MNRPLTNFQPAQLPIYEEAVRTSPQPGFSISKEPGWPENKFAKGLFSLWFDAPEFSDASEFWYNFDAIKARENIE